MHVDHIHCGRGHVERRRRRRDPTPMYLNTETCYQHALAGICSHSYTHAHAHAHAPPPPNNRTVAVKFFSHFD